VSTGQWNRHQIDFEFFLIFPKMVSVLEGQLTRTWFFSHNGRNHVISLYHDTLTGVRSAMLDFKEIRGSSGNSSLLMESQGHKIIFTVDGLAGYIEIKRSGWAGFDYVCMINNERVAESTENVADNGEPVFSAKVVDTTMTPDEDSVDYPIIWYLVCSTRLSDNVETRVHRRFREFAELNSQVKQNFKGHHLRAALPTFPEKTMKAFVHYSDPDFIKDRQDKLEHYLSQLIAIPHASDMICVRAFLGMMESVRELSIAFHVPTLGMTLQPATMGQLADDSNPPIVVGLIQKPELCEGVLVGDSLSKINGVPILGMQFNSVVHRIKSLPRPLIVHFIQVLGPRAAFCSSVATTDILIDYDVEPVNQRQSQSSLEGDGYVSLSAANAHTTTHAAHSPQQQHLYVNREKPVSIPDDLDGLGQEEQETVVTHKSSDFTPTKDTTALLEKHSDILFGNPTMQTTSDRQQYDRSAFDESSPDDDVSLVLEEQTTTV
jgi:hypothetical protein